MARKFLEAATTPAVREAQQRYYGRAQGLAAGPADERTPLSAAEVAFIAERDSFDGNRPQYITPRLTMKEVETHIAAPLRERISALEARLRAAGDLDPR